MAPVDLPYLMRVMSRGKPFWYYRRHGRLFRVQGQPGDPGFLRAYEVVHARHEGQQGPAAVGTSPGTLAALIAAYKASPDWRALKPATQKDYLKALNPLAEQFGKLPVATMPREFVLKLRDKYAEKDGKPTPRRANRVLAVLRLLMAWGVDRGWRKDNPALRPRMLRTMGGYRPWTRTEVARFMEADGVPVQMKQALRLALCTGQRKGDLLRLPWSAYDGASIQVTQAKTGAKLTILAHAELRAMLDGMTRTEGTILTRPDGEPWGEDHFNHRFAAAVKAAGLSGLVFHGLRHAAATWLADAGATPSQIAAITGHKTLAMVARYTESAGQAQRASEAVRLMEKHGQRDSVQTVGDEVVNRPPNKGRE